LYGQNVNDREDDRRQLLAIAGKMRQHVLKDVRQHGERRRADDRSEDVTRSAEDRHEQIFDAHSHVEGRWADVAAHMRIEPTR
jgi:hypothetical protein